MFVILCIYCKYYVCVVIYYIYNCVGTLRSQNPEHLMFDNLLVPQLDLENDFNIRNITNIVYEYLSDLSLHG